MYLGFREVIKSGAMFFPHPVKTLEEPLIGTSCQSWNSREVRLKRSQPDSKYWQGPEIIMKIRYGQSSCTMLVGQLNVYMLKVQKW